MAEMERFELSCRLLDKRISSASRYGHFGTSPQKNYVNCNKYYMLCKVFDYLLYDKVIFQLKNYLTCINSFYICKKPWR